MRRFYIAIANNEHIDFYCVPIRICLGLILMLCLYSRNCSAQNNATKERLLQQIAETEAEIERLQSQDVQSGNERTYCFEKVVYQEVAPMTNEEFEQFCKKEIPSLTNNKIGENYAIISSCKQTPSGVQANFCITTSPNVVNSSLNTEDMYKEKELQKIRNTKEMYKGLIQSLRDELKSNGIEIVDQSSNLAVKHLNIKGITGDVLKSKIKDLKDNMITKLRVKYNLDDRAIENENAQLVDDITNQAESLMSIIPGGNLVTCHYLWRILKSTPEIGKVIGNTGAIIHIYFQIDEFQKKLQQLEMEEKRILNG